MLAKSARGNQGNPVVDFVFNMSAKFRHIKSSYLTCETSMLCQREALISGDFANAARVSNSSALSTGGTLQLTRPSKTTTGNQCWLSHRATRAASSCKTPNEKEGSQKIAMLNGPRALTRRRVTKDCKTKRTKSTEDFTKKESVSRAFCVLKFTDYPRPWHIVRPGVPVQQ